MNDSAIQVASPLVSVIIPCYGVEKYLDRCLHGVVNQTITNIEIVLVDDGSPDKVPLMCDEWAKKDSRIKVIHKQNAGLGFARNSGLEIATGEYVAFIDSDDYVSEDMFMSLYIEAKKHDADVVFCGYQVEDARGIWHKNNDYKDKQIIEGEEVINYLLDMIACAPNVGIERKHAMSVWHGIYRRSLLESNNVRFISEREVVSEDLPFHTDVLLIARKIVSIPNCFYYYCLNDTSLTATFKPEKYNRFRYLHSHLIKKLHDVPYAISRIDRFFIGYTRSHIQHLLNSKRNDKELLLKEIVNDKIWEVIGSRYKPSFLPTYPMVFYWLQIHRMCILLVLYTKMTLILKKIFGYKIG